MAGGSPGGGASPGHRPGVYLEGLADLRKVLRKVSRDLDKGLARSMREIGKGVKRYAQAEARRFRDSGDLEKSIRYSVTTKGASVYSNSPYSAVHEWGGVIRPRGVPIRIARRQWMNAGVENSRRFVDSQMRGLLDSMTDDWGG